MSEGLKIWEGGSNVGGIICLLLVEIGLFICQNKGGGHPYITDIRCRLSFYIHFIEMQTSVESIQNKKMDQIYWKIFIFRTSLFLSLFQIVLFGHLRKKNN